MKVSTIFLQQIDIITLVDMAVTGLIVIVTIIAGLILIHLLLTNSRKRTSSAVALHITEALSEHRFDAKSETIKPLEHKVIDLNAQLARLQLEYNISDDTKQQEEIQKKIDDVRSDITDLKSQIREGRANLLAEAHKYAQDFVKDVIPSSLDISTPEQEKFFLEFTTVIVIIVGVIILALLEILNGEQLAPILASIAGYVLGRSMNQQGKT